jgi:hypothetical protein
MSEDAARELSAFREPGEFLTLLERIRVGIPREEIYRNPKNQPLKDAWQGGMLALGYQEYRRTLVEVRICVPAEFPDFQLRIAGKTFDFEATMVLAEGRRMTEEYRNDSTPGPVRKEKPEDLPPFDSKQLVRAIAKKAAKQYAAKPHLAVYLNIRGKGVELSNLAAIAQGKDGNAFESIWFVSDHNFGCGKPSFSLVAPDDWARIPVV